MITRFTDKDLFKLQQKGYKVNDPIIDKKLKVAFGMDLKKKNSVVSLSKDKIEFILIAMQIKYVKEHKFDAVRRFRFDFAIIEHKIAIEFEGVFSEMSRHTTYKGYTKDLTKYNLALINGWRVLRYTALNYPDVASDLTKLLK